MKKVTVGEKVFIFSIMSLLAGITTVLSGTINLLPAVAVGLGYGILGAAIVGLLTKARS